MSGRGPAPREPHQLVRPSNAEEFEALDPLAKAADAPDMPKGDWLPQTIEWWDTWVNSPQSVHFIATDWQRLKALMPLVNEYWESPSTKLLTEWRLNEERLGGTVLDRKRLRWKIEKAKERIGHKTSRSRKQKDPRARRA